MKTIISNIAAILLGILIGGAVNMGIIMISGSIIPPPENVNVSDMESLKASMHLFQPKHFLFPFLAHAIGTLVGAFLAAKIAANNKLLFALIIGFFFLMGGISMVIELPSPLWFNITDLGLAYIPMSWLGYIIATREKKVRYFN